MIPDRSDNTISCGKKNHPLCGGCKMKMLGTGGICPMCRSHSIPLPKSQEINMRVMKPKVEKKREPNWINIEGTGYVSFDGMYEEIRKDKNRISVYRNVMGYYLYRSSGKYSDWVLNKEYEPKTNYMFGWSRGKLLGNKVWNMVGLPDGEWTAMYVDITTVN